MRQENLLFVGLIVALTLAYSSAFRASSEATPLDMAGSSGERAPDFTRIGQVSAVAITTGPANN